MQSCFMGIIAYLFLVKIYAIINIYGNINVTHMTVDLLVALCSVYTVYSDLSYRCSQITLDMEKRVVGEHRGKVKGRHLESISAMTA